MPSQFWHQSVNVEPKGHNLTAPAPYTLETHKNSTKNIDKQRATATVIKVTTEPIYKCLDVTSMQMWQQQDGVKPEGADLTAQACSLTLTLGYSSTTS